MTLCASTIRQKIILDFGDNKYSKREIKSILNICGFIRCEQNDTKKYTVYSNIIKIGTFQIILVLPMDEIYGWRLLKEYGDFMIYIYDPFCIDLDKDNRFITQSWTSKNCFGKLRIKHLTDAIHYCMRLHALKCFS